MNEFEELYATAEGNYAELIHGMDQRRDGMKDSATFETRLQSITQEVIKAELAIP